MLELMEKVVLIFSLFLCAWTDWKKQEIYLVIPGVTALVGILFHLMLRSRTIEEIAAGMSIGVLGLLLAFLSKESIGYGDAVIFMVTGIYLGFWGNIHLLIWTFMLSGIAALYLIVWKKKGKTERIPMVPFVLVSYALLQV